jgi:hypothetical protein
VEDFKNTEENEEGIFPICSTEEGLKPRIWADFGEGGGGTGQEV